MAPLVETVPPKCYGRQLVAVHLDEHPTGWYEVEYSSQLINIQHVPMWHACSYS